MKAFPVVGRELRVSSRKWSTYWNRCGVAFGAIVVATFSLLILRQNAPKQAGNILFIWMSVIAYANCLLGGFILTADSLAEEKREGTLGLLFLTDLKGHDVVFGKLAANSLRGVYGLLAIFPILAICLLMGGVSAAQFVRVIVTCLNHLFLSLSVGMVFSALCRDERKAMASGFLTLLLLTAGLPALGAYVAAANHWREMPVPIFAGSPGFASVMAFDGAYKAEHFWPAIIVQHVFAWVCLIIACRVVPRSWQDRTATAGSERRQRTIRQWIYGPPQVRAAFRRRLLHVNPYYWLTSRDRFKQTLPWIWLSAVGLIWLGGLIRWRTEWRDEGTYIFTALFLHALFKVWVAFEASRRLGADRHSGALELLLSTPIQVSQLLRGQWLSLLRQFGAPVAVVLFADILFLTNGWPANESKEWLYLWLSGISVFIADLVAIAWLGMWLGLLNRRTGQGGVNAVVQICLLPWAIFVGFIAVVAVLETMRVTTPSSGPGSNFLFGVWWVISMGVDVLFGVNAYRRLHSQLRNIAMERYQGRAAVLGRMLGLAYGRWKVRDVTPPKVSIGKP